jgi:hypothetical protein
MDTKKVIHVMVDHCSTNRDVLYQYSRHALHAPVRCSFLTKSNNREVSLTALLIGANERARHEILNLLLVLSWNSAW